MNRLLSLAQEQNVPERRSLGLFISTKGGSGARSKQRYKAKQWALRMNHLFAVLGVTVTPLFLDHGIHVVIIFHVITLPVLASRAVALVHDRAPRNGLSSMNLSAVEVVGYTLLNVVGNCFTI